MTVGVVVGACVLVGGAVVVGKGVAIGARAQDGSRSAKSTSHKVNVRNVFLPRELEWILPINGSELSHPERNPNRGGYSKGQVKRVLGS